MPELLHRAKELSPFSRSYASLIEQGYRVLPLIPREKRPGVYKGGKGYEGMPSWAEWATRDVEEWRLEQWARWPDANIGLLHTADFIAIDFDNDIAGCHDRIKEVLAGLPGTVVRRQGKPGTYIQYFRGEGEIDSGVYRMGDDGNALEILALGRQSVAAPSMHPLGYAYQYVTDDTLEGTPREALPCLTPEIIGQIETILREYGWDEKRHREARQKGAMDGPIDSSGGIMSVCNQYAMRNLDGWVPDLGLANAERKGSGGWMATAHWRSGGTGRPIEKRKRNLHVDPRGIKDFGTNETFTPIDLVMRANGTDADRAWEWLWTRVGPVLAPWSPRNQGERSRDSSPQPKKQTLHEAHQKWGGALRDKIAPAIHEARRIRSLNILREFDRPGELDWAG